MLIKELSIINQDLLIHLHHDERKYYISCRVAECAGLHVDELFHNCKDSNYVDRRIIFSSGTSCYGFESFKNCERARRDMNEAVKCQTFSRAVHIDLGPILSVLACGLLT